MAFDLETGNIVWNYRQKNFPYFSSPAVTAKFVFIGGSDKGLHCINRITGKQEWRFSARGRIDSSPVVAGDKVVFGSMDGKLYVISLDSGEEISSYEVGESISSTPAVLSDRILVGCEDGKVYSFSTSLLKSQKKFPYNPITKQKTKQRLVIILYPITPPFLFGMNRMYLAFPAC